jgi:hypothetical protein
MMSGYIAPVGFRAKSDSTTIRKQMLQFVDTATDSEPGISAHPYGDSFDLSKAVTDTKAAAFRIAAAEQGFFFVKQHEDGETLSVTKLQESLKDRAAHWTQKVNEAQESPSSASSSTTGLVIGGILGIGLGVAAGALGHPALGLVTTMSITGFCFNIWDEERLVNNDKKGRTEGDLTAFRQKAKEYDIAQTLVPQWAEMNSRETV